MIDLVFTFSGNQHAGNYFQFQNFLELGRFDGFIEPLGPTAPFPPILLRKFKFFNFIFFISTKNENPLPGMRNEKEKVVQIFFISLQQTGHFWRDNVNTSIPLTL